MELYLEDDIMQEGRKLPKIKDDNTIPMPVLWTHAKKVKVADAIQHFRKYKLQ